MQKTPLHYAVERGHSSTVDLLLARGADIEHDEVRRGSCEE